MGNMVDNADFVDYEKIHYSAAHNLSCFLRIEVDFEGHEDEKKRYFDYDCYDEIRVVNDACSETREDYWSVLQASEGVDTLSAAFQTLSLGKSKIGSLDGARRRPGSGLLRDFATRVGASMFILGG